MRGPRAVGVEGGGLMETAAFVVVLVLVAVVLGMMWLPDEFTVTLPSLPRRKKKVPEAVVDVSGKAERRRESHNEWLLVWYNTLPERERDSIDAGFWDHMTGVYGLPQDMEAELRGTWILSEVGRRVHAVFHENTVEGVGGAVRGRAAREILVGAGTARGGGAARTVDAGLRPEACRTCACGPDGAC